MSADHGHQRSASTCAARSRRLLEDAGGWPVREAAQRFAEYADLVVAELGDFADDWIT